MNRLDPVSGQLVARPVTVESGATSYLRIGTWAFPGLALILTIWLGIRTGDNPADQIAQGLAYLPLLLIFVDLWALGIAIIRKSAQTPLRVPVKTPILLLILHLGTGIWALYLTTFDVFYEFEPTGPLSGIYVARWWIAVLLCLLALTAIALAYFQTRLVDWVLLSESTAVDSIRDVETFAAEPDMTLGSEHVYEAQVILHNLGYEVGGIDGELKEETREALSQLQRDSGLESSGEVTVLTMIELRNRWVGREEPPPGQSVKALSNHVFRRGAERITGWWKKRN